MRKTILMMALFAMPFMFSSCDSDEDNPIAEFTGSVSMTVGGQSINLPAAVFTKQNGRVILTSSNLNHSIAMYVDANATGTYTLGAAESIGDLVTHAQDVLNLLSGTGNYFLYSPSNDVQNNAKIILVGSVTFTEFSANQVKGSFTGYAVDKNALSSDLAALAIELGTLILGGSSSFVEIEGTFTAVGK
ncbi:MAG: hypothetical protein LBR17_04880 [Bacteroidales bacterium]|jgi:hypothetical protein|nr:hypothetical protein [Bacteroidales bacterium]